MSSSTRARLALIGAVLLLGIVGCARDPLGELPEPAAIESPWLETARPEAPWNLILVTLDTTRRDRLGCYGSDLGLTPWIDSLAARGILFEEAITPTPITLPSHATILTGLDPPRHGVHNNGTFVLGASHVTLAERLAEHGYATGAILGAFPVDAQFGLDQGFDLYDDDFPLESRRREWQTAQRRADEITDLALAWIAAQQGRPYFCWAHYFDPHFPYDPPAAFRKAGPHPYDGEVAFMDEQIGRLVAALRERGVLERTWLLIVADHGEALGEHGEPGHSMLLYGATQQVPCILVPPAGGEPLPPGTAGGQRVAELVRLCDLANTMLNALGLDRAAAIGEGCSLLPLLAGQSAGPRVAYCETLVPFLEYGWSELRSVRAVGWSYVRAPQPELYNLHDDPQELYDLHDAQPAVAARLADWCDFLTARESALEMQPLDPATIERLRSLGYVAGGVPQGAARNEKDPKRLMPLFNRINEARTALGAQRVQVAGQILEEVLQEDPGNPEALRLLGTARLRLADGGAAIAVYDSLKRAFPDDCEVRLGRARALLLDRRLGQAETELLELLAAAPERDDARELYAQVLLRDGRGEEAAALLAAAIARHPGRAAPRVALARLRWAQERMPAAQEAAEEALAHEPHDASARAILGECLWWRAAQAAEAGAETTAERLLVRAREELSAAIARDPFEPVAAFRLATLARERGDVAGAIELHERALVRRWDRAEVHVNLGNLLRETGRLEEALHAYRTALALGHEDVNFLVNYGVALAMDGRLQEALLTWERALERAPDQRYADGIRRNIEMLRARMRTSSATPAAP